jgi:hypothetical protein
MVLASAIGDDDGTGRITGSLYRNWNDQNVPNVNWNDGKLNVNWYNRDNANGNLRSREVVLQKSRRGLLVIFLLHIESSH